MPDNPQRSEQPLAMPGIYTETLARLYAQQGLYDQALVIYRHLLQTQPENPALQNKIAALEQQRVAAGMGQEVARGARLPVDSDNFLRRRARRQQVIASLERWLTQLRRRRRGGHHP
jgi:tetratricopeptide (TPR) repeat protein